MKPSVYYNVAGLTFGITLHEGLCLEGKLGAYAPFEAEPEGTPLFTLDVACCDDEPAGDRTLLLTESFEGVVTEIHADAGGNYHYVLRIADRPDLWACVDFGDSIDRPVCRIHGHPDFRLFALNNALMLLFSLCSSSCGALLFHASVISHGGRGYLFLGKSGTGKSTHSRLWLQHIEGCELLNDDNPVVRLVDGRPWVFGTPWSGKTPCYKNAGVPVGGFVRLWQAPVNEVERLSAVQAYAALLPTVSGMRWERRWADAVSATIGRVVGAVPVFSLKNRPERAAALLSFNALKRADESRM